MSDTKLIFVDYWSCDNCKDAHYGMCYKCGKCGRIFDNGICTNINEYPPSEDD